MALPKPLIDDQTLAWEPEHAARLRAFMAYHNNIKVPDLSALIVPDDKGKQDSIETNWLYPAFNGTKPTIQTTRLDAILAALRTLLNNDKLSLVDIFGVEETVQ